MDHQNSHRSLLSVLATLAFVLTGGCADEQLCLLRVPPPTTLTLTLDHQLPVADDSFEVLISNPYSSTSCVVGGASGTVVCDGDVVASASWSASEIVVTMESPFYDRDRSREVHPPENVEVLVSHEDEEVASLTVDVVAGPTLEPNGRGCGSKWMATAHGQVP
jgi:hypothetical protein